MRAPNVLRGFDDDMRAGRARSDGARRRRPSLRLPAHARREAARRCAARHAFGRFDHRGRSGAHRDRPPAQHRGAGPRSRWRHARLQHGAIKVDENMTSAVPSIHAIGDVTHRVNLTPVAIREGHSSRRPAVRSRGEDRSATTRSQHVVFCTPEVGAVGLTEAEAVERFPERRHVYKANFRPHEGDAVRAAANARS